MWPAILIATACQTSDPSPGKEEPESPILVSPLDGAEARVDVFPLVVRLPSALKDSSVVARLDGEEITDPLGLTRLRWAAQGGGAEYLATLDLSASAPGAHHLAVSFTDASGTTSVAESHFTWTPYPCALELTVSDPSGAPLAARAVLYADGAPLWYRGPNPGRADPMGRDKYLNAAFVEGSRTIYLPKKDITLLVSRGLRYTIAVHELPLSDGCDAGPASLQAVLTEAVPTPGQITADLHVHTAHSRDAFTPDRLRQSSLAAADLDLVVFSEHNHIWDPTPILSGPLSGLQGWAGTEARIGGYNAKQGHFNVYPLDPAAPSPEDDEDLRRLYDRWRSRQAEHPVEGVSRPLIQLNHPRGIQIRPSSRPSWRSHAAFTQGGFDRSVPVGEGANAWMTRRAAGSGTTVLDFDVLEVLNRFSWAQHQEVRADWFLLLNLGRTPTGVGNSDSHAMAVELLGYPVNLIATGGSRATADLVSAIDQGRLTVSSGPVVDLTLDGQWTPGDRAQGPTHTAQVRVRAAPWVPLREVRLIVNGQVVQRTPLPEALPPEGVVLTWPLSLERDAWVIAEAGWPPEGPAPAAEVLGDYARIAPGYAPLGFTNPIWIDADGDGDWRGRSPAEAAQQAAPLNSALNSRLGGADLAP